MECELCQSQPKDLVEYSQQSIHLSAAELQLKLQGSQNKQESQDETMQVGHPSS